MVTWSLNFYLGDNQLYISPFFEVLYLPKYSLFCYLAYIGNTATILSIKVLKYYYEKY